MTSSNPEQKSVLILGARGRFGSAAAKAFVQAGWRVHAQMRPGAGDTSGPGMAGVQWIAAAPEDTATLAAVAAGASVVVQALSPQYTNKAWRTGIPLLTEAAIAVTRALGCAPSTEAPTLMLPASVYNFGASMRPLLREDTPQAATTFKGRARIASEKQILDATQDGQMKAVVIRGGDFFGSGTGSWFDLVMAKALGRGKFTYPGALDVPTAWAYLPDMARSFVKVAEERHRLPAFDTLHFGGYCLTGQDWVEAATDMAREQGWLPAGGKLRVNSVSWPLMRLSGLFVPTLAALCEMCYLWRTPHSLANARLVDLIGEEPHTSFPEALRAALAERGMLGSGMQAAAAPQLSLR